MSPTTAAMNAECDQALAHIRNARDAGHPRVTAVAPESGHLADRLRTMLPGHDETAARTLMATVGKVSATARCELEAGTPAEQVLKRLLVTLAATAENLNRGAQS